MHANCNEFASSERKPDSRNSELQLAITARSPAELCSRSAGFLHGHFFPHAWLNLVRVSRAVPAFRSGMQEVHVDGADSAGLALAIRLAENMSASCRSKIYVWDGRLRRLGLRGRRLGLIATAAPAASSQIVTLQNDILSASLSPNAQAAVFAQSKERHWQHAVNTSIAKVEQALLRHAQSPALSQHIEFKLCDLAEDMLHAIASKPNVVIVGATGSQSAVRSLLVPAREPQIQQDIAHSVEVGYEMTAELKSCLKDYATTSHVFTMGQRVFLHSYDCQEGTGSISIRVTKDEFDALGHFGTASGSLAPNVTTVDGQDKQLPPMQSLAVKSLSHLIDSALHVYGVPPTSVRQTVGVSCSAWQAPVVAQKLHVGNKDTPAVLLIGDAAMQVEFWPGRGINTALASAHLAAVTLLTSMTHDPAQPCFAPSSAHLAHFSRQMTDMSERLKAYPSMDLLAIPPPSPRWSEASAPTAAAPGSHKPAQSPTVPQLIPSLPLQSPSAPQPVPMPANQIPATLQEPGPSEPSFQATPLPTLKDPGKAPGGQPKVAQAGTPSQSRVCSIDKTLARASVRSQPPAPAISSGQSLSPDASPDLSSGQSQSLGVSQVTTLGQRQSQTEPPAAASGQHFSSTAAPAADLGRNKSPAASPATASGQQQAPASSPATPLGHSPMSSSVMSPATCSGQQQAIAVSPAVPSGRRQSQPASPQAVLLSPEQPSPPPRPDLLPGGHPPTSQTAACQSGQRQPASQLQHREHSSLTDAESANETQSTLPGFIVSAALSPISILRPSPILGPSTAPDSSLSQLASELPMSSQQQGGSPGQPQTPLPSRTLRHVRSQNASEMPLRPDTIRHLQSQRSNRIMHASPSLPDICVRAEKSGQVETPEWLLQANSRHDVWQTPQVASDWSAKGNPLFGWWELGSAIIGDVSVSSPAADFSPCTPHRSEATETKSCDVKL
ncbi:hypothetical protein WJX82_009947 [Trebouxia sp. C0006]